MEKIKLAVFVSGGGTNLQALIDAQKNGIIENGEIKLVVSSNPDAYAVVRAEKEGITTAIVDKKLCKTQSEFEDKLSEELEKHSIEIIVLAGFMCILSERFTRLYDRRIINVHHSLIPSFCGKGFY